MRCFAAVFLLVGTLVWPRIAEALDCPWPGAWQYQAAGDVGVSAEKRARDLEARSTLQWLERTPIIFRGRIASARYLSDLRKTNMPTSLLVFDHVEILKGRLTATSMDRKAFVIRQEWCDGLCQSTIAQRWRRGDIVVIGAHPNNSSDPSQAVEPESKQVYRGRIDAVLGMCDRGLMTPMALDLLNGPADEIDRLKREYPRRRSD